MSSSTISDRRGPSDAPLAEAADAILRLDEASVRYRRSNDRVPSMKDYAIRRVRGQITFTDYWALRGVSLEIRRGETLGIGDIAVEGGFGGNRLGRAVGIDDAPVEAARRSARSMAPKSVRPGLNTTRTTSACPVAPAQTSS